MDFRLPRLACVGKVLEAVAIATKKTLLTKSSIMPLSYVRVFVVTTVGEERKNQRMREM